ncbi:MAG: 5-(carboxyamino)imidazole ribonucleotide synthase [Flavobacteriaceae bacterium]
MKKLFSSDFKLGVLGGGQLGRMLLRESIKFDIQTWMLDPSNEAPCKDYCNQFFQGDLMDYETVYNFGKKVDLLTIEIEHVNLDALEKLEAEGLDVFPQPSVLRKIQHKGVQKDFYTANALPTADYVRFDSKDEALSKAAQFDFPFIWKSAQFGYDGNGVKVIRTAQDLKALSDVEGIFEKMIPFDLELAVIVARNPKGDLAHYPVVEMEFHPEANQVEYVLCPARISDEIAQKAIDVALQAASKFEHVGLLAVELFLTKEGDVLINEVAPRTHNSGHYSIEGSYTSQFEQHLRSVLNLPLGSTKSTCPAVMVNLVGAEGYSGEVKYQGMEDILALPGVTPHIYGKKLMRPFRKMGHVTVIGDSIEEARKIAEEVKSKVKVISE